MTIINIYNIIKVDNKGGVFLKQDIKEIMHPLRIRILQLFSINTRMTARQMEDHLGDVALPTLYRHLNSLVKFDYLEVKEQIPNRGTVEKVYGLRVLDQAQSLEDLKKLSAKDHMQMFVQYQMQMLQDFNSYLDSDFDIIQDGASYKIATLHLTYEELIEMSKEMSEVLMKYIENKPTKDRYRLNLYTVSVPNKNK